MMLANWLLYLSISHPDIFPRRISRTNQSLQKFLSKPISRMAGAIARGMPRSQVYGAREVAFIEQGEEVVNPVPCPLCQISLLTATQDKPCT